MEEFISLETIIKMASKRGVNFGKGDPYNRLRYYTKLGLLPHMVRRSINGELVGHYPSYALDTLVEIEKLKSLGLQNKEIEQRLKQLNSRSLQTGPTAIKIVQALTPSAKTLRVGLFIIFCLMLLAGLGVLPVGKSKNDLIKKTLELDRKYISDSGTAYLPRDKKRIYIKSNAVKTDSRINVTFGADYSPATRYWISQKTPYEGFYLELDAPISADAEFSWWVSN